MYTISQFFFFWGGGEFVNLLCLKMFKAKIWVFRTQSCLGGRGNCPALVVLFGATFMCGILRAALVLNVLMSPSPGFLHTTPFVVHRYPVFRTLSCFSYSILLFVHYPIFVHYSVFRTLFLVFRTLFLLFVHYSGLSYTIPGFVYPISLYFFLLFFFVIFSRFDFSNLRKSQCGGIFKINIFIIFSYIFCAKKIEFLELFES